MGRGHHGDHRHTADGADGFLDEVRFDDLPLLGGRFGKDDGVGGNGGETVLVATGSAARVGCDCENAPVDAAIVGIVDSGTGFDA